MFSTSTTPDENFYQNFMIGFRKRGLPNQQLNLQILIVNMINKPLKCDHTNSRSQNSMILPNQVITSQYKHCVVIVIKIICKIHPNEKVFYHQPPGREENEEKKNHKACLILTCSSKLGHFIAQTHTHTHTPNSTKHKLKKPQLHNQTLEHHSSSFTY